MYKVTVDYWKNIPAGEKVFSGFGYELTAPAEEGTYTLYERVNPDNTHAGWEWVKQ